MKWTFDNDRAIYSQIIEQMRLFIASGRLLPGERLMSVRELASMAGVNPNTMQKALSELEQEGLLFSNRTAGRFVTEDAEKISDVKNSIAREKTKEFFSRMKAMGYNSRDILEIIKTMDGDFDE